jgi:hypothetical protein
MPCFQHPSGHQLPNVPAGTEVYLSKVPNSDMSPAKLYVWGTGSGDCNQHGTPAAPGFEFSHSAKLKRAIAGFVAAGFCRGANTSKVLYVYGGSGADIKDVKPTNQKVCE